MNNRLKPMRVTDSSNLSKKTSLASNFDPEAETARLKDIRRANAERIMSTPRQELNITRTIPFDPDVLKR